MTKLSDKMQRLLDELRYDHTDEEILDACCDGSWLDSRTVAPEEVEQLYNYLTSTQHVHELLTTR